mmetsp:Transcript_22194/g.37592  ORF Transcript_22194/g.37592 Transcript_22194/m.37592 type:complete len:301 (-) Transcript_22194:286-1188(-)
MANYSTIYTEGDEPPTSSPLTNGPIVRFVGRNRIEDGCLNLALSIAVPPLTPIQCVYARFHRESWSEVLFQLFGFGSVPTLPSSLLLHPTKLPSCLRFVCISDTHMQHSKLNMPDGDVLIHCGDFTNHGSLKEVREFAAWLTTLSYKHIIIVPGNHDMILDIDYYNEYWSDWSHHKEDTERARGLLMSVPNATLLIDEGITVEGITLWGSPWVPQHGNWKTGFNKDSLELHDHWKDTLPEQVDILITHTPSKGVGDREPWGHSCGCPHLLDEVARLKPKYHVFGHIHSDYGVHKVTLPHL